jgi:hypothetical protein
MKTSSQISSSSLQNPSDPDASYDEHKRQKYQVQVMEVHSPPEAEQDRNASQRLITLMEMQIIYERDAHALVPALESAVKWWFAPEEAVADSHYGSDENCKSALEMRIDLISTCRGIGEGGDYTPFRKGKGHRLPTGASAC